MGGMTRVLALAALVTGLTLVSALPASASHENRPRTKNLHPMGDTDDNRPIETFEEPFFTDLAFWGKYAYQGTWNGGFRVVNIAPKGHPKVLSEVDCGTEQGDIGVWRKLVFRSIDVPVPATTPQETCDAPPFVTESGFEGIQIFRVRNPKKASADDLVTAVATDCGSHTHTVVPDLARNRVLIYIGSNVNFPQYSETSWGNECAAEHKKFQIVAVPLGHPKDAAVLKDVSLGDADMCHDIGVLLNGPGRNLAVCAGMDMGDPDDPSDDVGKGVIFDISDPANPVRLRSLVAPGVSSWHSAALSWDGRIAVMGWEPGGGVEPECEASDPAIKKSVFFFDTATGRLLGTWVLPRPQSELENCTIHNYSVVPTRKRNVLTLGAYQAGTWVVDFTNPAAARTVAWSDQEPLPCCTSPFLPLSLGGAWGSYWYNGFIFESNITQGLNIFRLSSRVTAGARRVRFLNPQTQLGPLRH
jgi:LVIVD repeat